MKDFVRIWIAVAVFFGVTTFTARASGPQIVLSAVVQRELISVENGQESVERVPVETVSRGDILVYTVTYKNEGGEPASGTSIVNPLPEGTTYILNSAKGQDSEITYSIDGGKYFQEPPVQFQVKKDDGTMENRTAPADMFTHIRWVIQKSLPPGSSGEVEFKAKVD